MYTVNASNANAALAASGAGGEIKEAIQAGMEVTFHERGINANGWNGTGYSIVDPETGVGSYLIEGKGNGGYLTGFGIGVSVGVLMAVEIRDPGTIKGLVAELSSEFLVILACMFVILFSIFSIFDTLQNKGQITLECLVSGFVMGLGLSLGFAANAYCKTVTCSNILGTVVSAIGGYLGKYVAPRTADECGVHYFPW